MMAYENYRTKTQDSIRYYNWGLIALIISQIVGILVAIFLVSFIMNILSGGTISESQAATIIGFAGAACGYLLIVIVAYVFLFIAFIYSLMGKDEFGKEHSKNIMMALFFLIIAIVMSIIPSMVGSLATMNTSLTGTRTANEIISGAMTRAIISGVGGILTALFVGLFLYYNVKLFVPKERMNYIIGAFAFLVMGAVVGLGTSIYLVGRMGEISTSSSVTDLDQLANLLNTVIGISSIGGLVSIGGYVLFLIVYRDITGKFSSGQIKPEIPMMQQVMPYYVTYPVYPQYMYTPVPQQGNVTIPVPTQQPPQQSEGAVPAPPPAQNVSAPQVDNVGTQQKKEATE